MSRVTHRRSQETTCFGVVKNLYGVFCFIRYLFLKLSIVYNMLFQYKIVRSRTIFPYYYINMVVLLRQKFD